MKKLHMAVGVNIFAVIFSLCAVCALSFAADVGTVTYIEGRVDTLSQGSDTGMPIRQGDAVSTGDSLRTKSNAKLEVTFNDKSVLRVAQNSKVVIKDYQLDENSRRLTANLLLERGKARTIIAKMPKAAEFIISTPNASGTVKGSDIFTSYQAGNSGMLVADGKLSVINTLKPQSPIVIPAGNAVVVSLEDSPNGPRQYFDTEKKLYEQDTDIPATVTRTPGTSIIKGAIAKLSGDVKITFKSTGETRAASVNDIVEAGDFIETGENGMVEIKFDNGNGINLKPDSNIRITSLIMDPKTGEYDNLFESTKGRIRSRIEGLKGKSKFEIKTPIAVSGARGTIMYLEITQSSVRAFFEGGTGSIASLISGVERMVAAGENASSGISGTVSQSIPTSASDRMAWGEGWTPGNGTEGYSSPDGSGGVYLSDEGGNIGIIGRDSLGDLDDGIDHEPFSDPLLPINTEEEEGTSSEEISFSSRGSIDSSIFSYDGNLNAYSGACGSFSGMIRIMGTFWDGGSASFISPGDITAGTESNFIWSGLLHSYIQGSSQDYYNTSVDGGAFYGPVSGIGGFMLNDIKLLDGAASLLYVDPNGDAGVAQGDLAGEFSENSGEYFLVSSRLTGTTKVNEIGINPSELIYYVVKDALSCGMYYGEGMISGYSTAGYTYYISGQKWGVYNADFASGYNSIVTDGNKTWIADVSGNGYFGNRDVSSFGIISGKFFGVYDGEGKWLGTSIGSWESMAEGEEIAGEYAADYVGFAGGVLGDETMLGNMVAIYDQSPYTGYNFEQSILSLFGEYEPIFYGGFYGSDNMEIYGFEGKFYNIAGQDWGIWGARLTGSAYESGNLFHLFMAGDVLTDYGEYIATDGYWFGLIAGMKMPGSERIAGVMKGISLSFIGDGYSDISLVSGAVEGNMDVENYWEMVGMGTWKRISTGQVSPESASDFHDNYIISNDVNMTGSGAFEKGGSISVDSFYETMFNVVGQQNGIWVNAMSGTCNSPTGSFDVGLYGIGGDEKQRYILCEVKGTNDNDILSATANGIWLGLADNEAGALVGGTSTGQMVGYIDVDETGAGSWEAVAAGEWVEAETLLDTTNIATLNSSIEALANTVNIPLTEVYNVTNMIGAGTGGIASAAMDVNLYALQPNMLQGIWASIISGTYTTIESPKGWSATVANGSDTATLSGTNWADGQWAANVSGTIGGNSITGQAGGTYTPGETSGTFTGVGAGTWNAPGTTPVEPPSQG